MSNDTTRVRHPARDRGLKMSRKNFTQLKETSKTVTYGKGVPHVKQRTEKSS